MTCSPSSLPAIGFVYRRWLHVLALVTACAVFPLIFVGAGVTSKDAGLAYPDGFTSAGYFLRNPPGWWERDDTRWEHGHRLVGRTVGVLAIALAIGCWRRGGTVRGLGLCNLLAVITQGLLGAFRVNEVSTLLAMIHGIFGQICFCIACTVALVTGRTWMQPTSPKDIRGAGSLQTLCLVGTVATFLQLVLGAALRHFGSNAALLTHVFGAMVVTLLVGWIAMWIMSEQTGRRLLVWFGRAIAVLMVLQLLLGGYAFTVTVMGGRWSAFEEWVVPSAHVGVGALLFAFLVMATLSTYRLLRPAAEPDGSIRGSLSTT